MPKNNCCRKLFASLALEEVVFSRVCVPGSLQLLVCGVAAPNA